MNLSLLLYLIDILGTFKTVTFFAVVLGLAGFPISYALADLIADKKDYEDNSKVIPLFVKYVRIVTIAETFFILLLILIPSKTTLYSITAVEVSKQLISEPSNKELIDKTYKLINKKLDEELKENHEKSK